VLTTAGSGRPRPLVTPQRARGWLVAIAVALLGALLAACSSSARVAETDSVVGQVPFIDGERYEYSLVDRDGEVVGTGTFTTDRDDDTWVLTQTYTDTDGVTVDESRVVVDATTLQPHSTERVIVRNGETEVVTGAYETDADGGRTVQTSRVVHSRDGGERERTIDINAYDYEDQSSLWLWRTLALGEGLDARYTTVDPREGGRVTANVVQIDRQMLETPFGLTYDTWVLQIRTGRETVNVWVHVDAPHEVVRFDNGRLFFELEWAGLR